MCSSDQPIGPQSYPGILYNAFTNPVRGLLDTKSHLQSFNGCIYMKNETKMPNRKKIETKKIPERIGGMQERVGNPEIKRMHATYSHTHNTKRGTR